jgi:hypothetical protein
VRADVRPPEVEEAAGSAAFGLGGPPEAATAALDARPAAEAPGERPAAAPGEQRPLAAARGSRQAVWAVACQLAAAARGSRQAERAVPCCRLAAAARGSLQAAWAVPCCRLAVAARNTRAGCNPPSRIISASAFAYCRRYRGRDPRRSSAGERRALAAGSTPASLEETLGKWAQNCCLGNRPSDFFLRMSEDLSRLRHIVHRSLRDFLWGQSLPRSMSSNTNPSKRNRRALTQPPNAERDETRRESSRSLCGTPSRSCPEG